MSSQYVIFAGDRVWRVACVTGGQVRTEDIPVLDEPSASELAHAVREQLTALGYAGQPALLGLPSAWCLTATVSTAGLQRGNRRQAMAFRLEEHLPLSAEEFAADCIDLGGDEALGICIETARVKPIVDALQDAGIELPHASPVAMLGASYAAAGQGEPDAVVTARPAAVEPDRQAAEYDLIELRQGRTQRWWWLSDDVAALRDRLGSTATGREQATTVVTIGTDEAVREAAAGIAALEVTAADADVDTAAARQAAAILQRGEAPPADLRQDALAPPDPHRAYRKPLAFLAAAAVLLLLLAAGVAWYRGRQYQGLRERYQYQQAELYRQVMDAGSRARVPASVRRRLASERRKLAGVGGQADESGGKPLRSASSLTHLRAILRGLPTGMRFRVLELSIDADLIRIEGQARSHIEAERIAVALRQTGLYQVEPPKTQALRDRGVSFLLTAKPRSTELAAGDRP